MPRDRLEGVHPKVVMAAQRMIAAMDFLSHPVMVTDGLRTAAQQADLYARGRTVPGTIVTYADGVKNKSNHQAKTDGFGHAVDFCFLRDGKPSWAEIHPWKLLGEMGKALGLRWGGDWTGKLVDRPHFEL